MLMRTNTGKMAGILCLLAGTVSVQAAASRIAPEISALEVSVNIPAIVTICENPADIGTLARHSALATPGMMIMADVPGEKGGFTLSLVKQGDQYDILTPEGRLSEQGGIENFNDGNQGRSIHLVMDGPDGMEHYLFVLDAEGSGELLWSSASMNALAICQGVAGAAARL